MAGSAQVSWHRFRNADCRPVIPRVERTLSELRDQTNETIILGARQGERVIYLAVVEGKQTIRYISQAEELKPMHPSAIGTSLLMGMSAADRSQISYEN